jgi:hypothetical protein
LLTISHTFQNAELETKLARLRGGAKLVSKADKDKAEKQYELVRVRVLHQPPAFVLILCSRSVSSTGLLPA